MLLGKYAQPTTIIEGKTKYEALDNNSDFYIFILFGLGLYFFITTKWVGPGKYYVGNTNILGWIAVIAFITYFIDRVIIKNK